MQKIYKRKLKGFTLVELIIVITILAILATIAFVSFQSYTSDSRDTTRISNLTSLQKWLDAFALKVWQYPLPDDIYGTWLYTTWAVNDTLNYVWYVKENVSRLISINKVPMDPVSNTNFIYWVSINQNKYQIAATLEKAQNTAGIITTTYAATPQAKLIWNYTYPLKVWTKVYSLPSLVFMWTGNLLLNSTWFIINNGQNLPYSIDGKPLNNTQTTAQVLQTITWTPSLSLTGIDVSSYTGAQAFKSLSSVPTELQWLWLTKDQIGISLFWDPYLAAIAPKPWKCEEPITTLDGSQTYTTIKWYDGKCRTSQNMRHGSKLWSAWTNPSNNNLLEKWCYGWLDSNCDLEWALYSWKEAMGIDFWDNATAVENSSKSVCWQLSGAWSLPTTTQWSALQTAGATGWMGNKLSWIISYLPWYIHDVMWYYQRWVEWYRWTGSPYDANWAYYKSLNSANSTIWGAGIPKARAFSVVCIRN